MKNMQWGMSVVLVGDDKVKGQFKMLDDTLVTANTSFDKTGNSAKKAGDKIEQAGNDAKTAGVGAKQGADGFNKVGTETEKAGKKAKTSQSFWKSLKDEFFSLKGIMAGLGIGLLTSQIIGVGNVTEGWNASMYAVAGSQAAATQELQHTRELAKYLGADIKSTTDSYIQFSAATKGSALEGFKTTKVFDAVSTAMRVLNRSADDTSGALKALEQMVSKGTVSSEELKQQLGERLPGAFRLAAESMGVTTMQLGKMLESGSVLAEDLLPKLADVLTQKYGPGLEAALTSPAQAFRNLKNASFEFYEGLSNAVFDELAMGAQALADAMQAVIPHLPVIISGLGSLVKIIAVSGALYLGYLGLSAIIPIVTTAMTGLTLATLRTRAATLLNTISLKLFNSVLFQTVATVGLLKSAFFALAALYAGWEFGSWLSENFLEAKLAGFAFVRGMEVSFAYLSTAFDQAMVAIKFGWESSLNGMRKMAGSFYSAIASGLSAVGADETAAIYTRAAANYTAAIKPVSDLTAQINSLSSARDEEITKIDTIINSLVAHEIAVANGTKTIKENTDIKKENARTPVTTVTELTANETFIQSLGEQLNALHLTGKQKLLNTNLSKLSKDATEGEKAAVKALTDEQYKQLQIQNQTKQDDDFYQNAIDGVNGYSEAWSSAGNVIIDTFGSIGQQMEKLFTSQDAYTQAIEINHKKQQIAGADIAKLKKEEAQLTRANAQSEINSYGSIAGAAAGMFSEKTAAYKAFHAVEQALSVVSLAMSVEKMLSSTAETTAVVANETIKQTALGTTAIISQGQGDPYTAWARIAAMVALVAGLGIATSGGSGTAPESAASRQETQGTGTVLGSDDKSASIYNALERAEDLQLDQYAVLREMLTSLDDLNNNITRLATSLVSNFGKFDEASYSGLLGKTSSVKGKVAEFHKIGAVLGDPVGDLLDGVIGSFKTTKKTLLDSGISIVSQTMGDIIDTGLVEAQRYFDIKTKKKSFWGASSSTSYNTEYEDVDDDIEHEMGLVFKSLGNTVLSAATNLGFSTVDVVETEIVKSFDGKGSTSVFSKLFGEFTEEITTTTEMSLSDALSKFEIDLPNISFKDLSGDEITAELEAVISQQADLMATYLVPNLRDFQQVGEGLYETLTRLAQEQAVFNSVLELTGNAMATVDANTTIAATQAIIEFAGGIENLQDAASTFFSEFLSDDEQFAHLQKNLTAQFEALGKPLPATADAFKDLIQTLDPLAEADQKLYAQLLLLSGQSAEYYHALDDQLEKEKELSDARKSFNDDLTAQIANMDLTPLEQSLNSLNNQYVEDLANALELGADISLLEVFYGKQRTKIIEEQLGNAKTTFDTAISGIADGLEKLIDSIANTRTGIAASIRNIKKQMGGFDEVGFINSNINGLYNDVGTGSISEQIDAVESLNDLIMQRYELELEQQTSLQDVRTSLYDEQLAQYDSLKSAIKSIGSYSKGLSLSSYSPLSSSQRLNVASSNFSSDLSAAQNFDLTALENLGSSADAYLEEARNMFGSSGQFSAIFNSVQSRLNQIANLDATAPEQLSVDELYQKEAIALQTGTIAELQGLGLLLDDLETQANNQAATETVVVTEQFNTQVALIQQTNELSKAQLEKQTQQVALTEKSVEVATAQLESQKQTTQELTQTVAQQAQIITVLQQQLVTQQQANNNQNETNSHIIHNIRQM